MTHLPLTDASALRAAGRQPRLPFRVLLADGGVLLMLRLLRVLPGNRVVGEAELNGSKVLAKLFIGQRGERHWQQERTGLAALAGAGVPTPALLAATALAGGGYALMTDFLDPAESLAESWERLAGPAPGDGQALALLAPALTLLGRLHAAGLVQQDLHLGNFLRHEDTWLLIDGDAVRVVCPGQRLPLTPASANLAILLAQLPAAWDGQVAALLPAYAAGASDSLPDLPALSEQIRRCLLYTSRCV